MDVDIISDLSDGTFDGVATPDTGQSAAPANTPPKQTKRETVEDRQTTENKPLSLRDQLSSALKGSKDTPPSGLQDGNGGRPRNPDGTFAPSTESLPPDTSSAPTPAGGSVSPPAGVDAQVFNSLPAETQQFIARTMDELNHTRSQLGRMSEIEKIIGPRRDAWALNGMTEVQAVGQLFALSDYATRDPKGFIQYFAQNNNVDLESLVFDTDPGDPEVNALKQQINQLQSQLEGFNAQTQQASHQNMVNQIVSFFGETSADGKPLRPYADQLGADLVPYVQLVMQQKPNLPQTQILQEAYERACWGNAEVRKAMQQEQIAIEQAKQAQAAQQKLQKARDAGSSMPSGVPSGAEKLVNGANTGSLRDTIRSALSQYS